MCSVHVPVIYGRAAIYMVRFMAKYYRCKNSIWIGLQVAWWGQSDLPAWLTGLQPQCAFITHPYMNMEGGKLIWEITGNWERVILYSVVVCRKTTRTNRFPKIHMGRHAMCTQTEIDCLRHQVLWYRETQQAYKSILVNFARGVVDPGRRRVVAWCVFIWHTQQLVWRKCIQYPFLFHWWPFPLGTQVYGWRWQYGVGISKARWSPFGV